MTPTTEATRWVDLPDAPTVPDLRFRAWRDVADYASMATIMGASNMADGVPSIPTAQEVRGRREGDPRSDPPLDIILAEVDGRPIACAGQDRVVRDGEAMFEIWGYVDPAFRRRGIGSALIGWNVRRAHERAAKLDPGQPVVVQAFADEGQDGQLALLAAHGYDRVRQFFLMRRDLTAPIPDAPLPDGLELRPVTPDQHRPIHGAQVEAFRDHWGSREPSEHEFETTYAREELDTGLWVIAWDGDQIAGVVENWIYPEENATLGVARGWLESISVRRPWRRRGLARALTAASLARLRDAGMLEGMLGVDATNPQGALGLYEDLGFEIKQREGVYRRTYPWVGGPDLSPPT
jgi:mycothiol synthase